MLGVGVILYIFARTLPRITDEDLGKPEIKTSKTLLYLERADRRFKMSAEKLLRRCRVVILKIDNSLSERLSSFKKDNEKNGRLPLGLKEKPPEEKSTDY